MLFSRYGTVAALILLFACEDEPPPADQTYETRGRITHLSATDLGIHHEAIPTFVDRDGVVAGMPAMVMQFSVAEGVSVGDLSEGDPVALTFEVRWRGGDMLTVTRVEELPADTELVLERGASDH